MPRVDCLFDQNYLNQAKEKLLKKYPQLVGKKNHSFMHQLLEEIFTKDFQCFLLME